MTILYNSLCNLNDFQRNKYLHIGRELFYIYADRDMFDFAVFSIIRTEENVWKEMKKLGFKVVEGGPCPKSKWECGGMTVEFDEERGTVIAIFYLNRRWRFHKAAYGGGYREALEVMREHHVRQIIES